MSSPSQLSVSFSFWDGKSLIKAFKIMREVLMWLAISDGHKSGNKPKIGTNWANSLTCELQFGKSSSLRKQQQKAPGLVGSAGWEGA